MSEQAIAATNARLADAVAKGDAESCAACYTNDAKFMAPNAEAFAGRNAIRDFFQGAIEGGIGKIVLETSALEILGDTAWEEGLYQLQTTDGEVADRGKFLVIWKGAGDDWLLHRDMISTNLPAA